MQILVLRSLLIVLKHRTQEGAKCYEQRKELFFIAFIQNILI